MEEVKVGDSKPGSVTDGAIALAPMAERYRRPDWVRRINLIAQATATTPRQIVPIEADELLELAAAAVGGMPSGDFGDPDWRGRFEKLVRAVDAADLHLVGRLITKGELLRALRSRLLMTHAVDRSPEIFDERIVAPMIVTGPARSGTTILFELLSLDSTLRAPTAFNALHPVAVDETGSPDTRLNSSEFEQELWADIQPEFAAMHELRSDLPVECVTLDMPSFCGSHWAMIAKLGEWAPEIEEDYAFHRRILQFMQVGRPKLNWLLKTPGHLGTLPTLFETYPDAWVLQTHRDPAKTMPSTVSITAMVQWMRTEQVDLGMLRTVIEAVFAGAQNHTVELRTTGALPDRMVDVHFQDMMKDPVSTLRRAYDVMGREFSDEHAENVRRYLTEKPKGKFGTHKYTPEEWGFTSDGVRAKLAPYIDHFNVTLE